MKQLDAQRVRTMSMIRDFFSLSASLFSLLFFLLLQREGETERARKRERERKVEFSYNATLGDLLPKVRMHALKFKHAA